MLYVSQGKDLLLIGSIMDQLTNFSFKVLRVILVVLNSMKLPGKNTFFKVLTTLVLGLNFDRFRTYIAKVGSMTGATLSSPLESLCVSLHKMSGLD